MLSPGGDLHVASRNLWPRRSDAVAACIRRAAGALDRAAYTRDARGGARTSRDRAAAGDAAHKLGGAGHRERPQQARALHQRARPARGVWRARSTPTRPCGDACSATRTQSPTCWGASDVRATRACVARLPPPRATSCRLTSAWREDADPILPRAFAVPAARASPARRRRWKRCARSAGCLKASAPSGSRRWRTPHSRSGGSAARVGPT